MTSATDCESESSQSVGVRDCENIPLNFTLFSHLFILLGQNVQAK